MAVPWQAIDAEFHKQVLQVRGQVRGQVHGQVQAVHKKVIEPDRFATKTELGSKGHATTHKDDYEAFQKSLGLQPKAGWKPSQPRQLQRYPSDATTEGVPSPVARYWAQKEMMDNYKKY